MRLWPTVLTVAVVAVAGVAVAQEVEQGAPPDSACVACHADRDLFEIDQVEVVADFLGSVHAQVGLTCTDCHGGNDDPELFEDLDAAMDPGHPDNPYVGVPGRAEIPASCGSCHSNLQYMRRFRPDARVDQETEYWTSGHGIALAAGDTNVATCTDCHGAHDILRADVPESHVYARNVSATCGRCHSDGELMGGYTLADGRPFPTDQRALWRRSVHGQAMMDREDTFAPTCNDCHGNHGAMPPGLDSITYVCGQCHGREAEMFRESSKHSLWIDHNDYVEGAGFESCGACHEAPEPQAAITDMYHFGECSSCHGNHGVVRPTLAFFAPFDRTPCAFCHESHNGSDGELEIAGRYDVYIDTRDELIAEAKEAELFGEDQFNFLVDRSLTLPEHGAAGSGGHGDPSRQRFERLFEKFRIGRTYYEYTPDDGADPVRVELQRCTWCHSEAPLLADESRGHEIGHDMADQVLKLMAATTKAEATVAEARRGGIELRDALTDLDHAVDTQIDLQVLVHRFETDGPFADALEEGHAFAAAALAAGEEAHAELRFRRVGLFVFLAFVIMVLFGLAMKIRQA